MAKRLDLNLILAHNLRFFMRRSDQYQNANALGVAANISPNTVRNYLDPKKRTVTTEKPEGFPTIDKLASLSEKLGCQVWELLHPDIERSLREREMYGKIEQDFIVRAKSGDGVPMDGPPSKWPDATQPVRRSVSKKP
jgi:hypothetical protein